MMAMEDEESSMTNVSVTGIINTLIDDADEVNVSASSDDVNVSASSDDFNVRTPATAVDRKKNVLFPALALILCRMSGPRNH